MDRELLNELARHHVWADAQHWKTLHDNPALLADGEIRGRLTHMLQACRMLTKLARGEAVDPAAMKNLESIDVIEAAMGEANQGLAAALASVDPANSIHLSRGPKGPFDAPAGVVLLQALMHGQHHRGQNAARMRALGVTPPLTDFILWHALGRP
jgi:uncharacterized damage-inducible protein DinB